MEQVRQIRIAQTPELICKNQALPLLPFFTEVWSYGFEDEPNYSKLKQLLRCILLDENVVPDLRFDWSGFPKSNLTTQNLCEEVLVEGEEEVRAPESIQIAEDSDSE